MIKNVVHDPAALTQPAAPATKQDLAVATDLLDTLKANADRCVGMGANMIGSNKAVIVVQMGPFAIPMFNPKITKKAGAYQTQEGCLSLAGERPTTRYHQITVQFQDRQFNWQTQAFTDFTAQIIQHEIDHCHGILI
ncbi:peptide deformylase [Lactiplantibacillus daowaiensis]|uniref:Peptide deformylase n=1 Tax=Lactiplantibacillus daowaiensis TaxID=2559918 RepID=A0ABW1S1M4_9LACO|nr:peptide deformylase [Lactiplantibacillus daowaiensis]